jgi:hypothetical protein
MSRKMDDEIRTMQQMGKLLEKLPSQQSRARVMTFLYDKASELAATDRVGEQPNGSQIGLPA